MTLSELVIERLAFGGSGVGRIDGKVCFVPFSAPGDHLKVRVIKEHRSWLEAELTDIVEASPLRVQPTCPVFGRCGGCDWQHLHYVVQAEAKRSILLDTLQRVGKLADPSVGQTVPAPAAYGYRARAQFKLQMTADGCKAGFYRRGSRSVIDLPQGCPVVTPAINGALARLRQQLEDLPEVAAVSQISIEEGEEGCHAMLRYTGTHPQELAAQLFRQADQLDLAGLFLQTGRLDALTPVFGDARITYQVPSGSGGELLLGYGMGGFSQVNRQQNRTMIELVRQLLLPGEKGRLLDLYCGNGNLSLPLADQCSQVVGIEGYQPSIASAVDNSRQVRVNNSTFRCADAAAELQRLIAQQQRFATVVLDPPRTGAPDVVKELPLLGASRIIYVSCDPGTLARDLTTLVGSGSYRLDSALPLDMFPQTGHLETVACLTRT